MLVSTWFKTGSAITHRADSHQKISPSDWDIKEKDREPIRISVSVIHHDRRTENFIVRNMSFSATIQ